MEFRLPYLQAMRSQAPKMFNEMSRSGKLDEFVEGKVKEAHRLFRALTKDAPKEPGGYPRQPFAREAEEQVRSQLIDFTQNTESSPATDESLALLKETPQQ